jgi:hypothetical protein
MADALAMKGNLCKNIEQSRREKKTKNKLSFILLSFKIMINTNII